MSAEMPLSVSAGPLNLDAEEECTTVSTLEQGRAGERLRGAELGNGRAGGRADPPRREWEQWQMLLLSHRDKYGSP